MCGRRSFLPDRATVGIVWPAVVLMICGIGSQALAQDPPKHPAVLSREFVYETAPFKSCHASTLIETDAGPACAFFAGDDEGEPNVEIWFTIRSGTSWSPVRSIATGVQPDGSRYPCWNPVLHREQNGTLTLFYKVGPSPSKWWGLYRQSADGGSTWNEPVRLPDGILGPIKNKPMTLADGRLLCPSSDEEQGWVVRMETRSADGKNWSSSGPLNGSPKTGGLFDAIQPTILRHPDNSLQILCRTKQRVVAESWSVDQGQTWSPLAATWLPNPNSGIDAVTLRDGRHLLVYNPTRVGRFPLSVAVSKDGKSWTDQVILDWLPGEYSYPAVIQQADGTVRLSYTWNRLKVRTVTLDPAKL